MERKLTSARIDSYCGNVVPLRLLGGTAYGKDPIIWESDSDSVQLTSFEGQEDGCFTDGVLLTLVKPGSAVVSARLGSKEYRCQVTVRKMRTASSGQRLNYYIGDLHDHTCKKHKVDEFRAKKSDYPIDFIRQIRDEGKLDFCVVSDHACLLNHREYFRGYADAEDAQPMELIVFPGCEAEITPLETDRYGIVHKNAGEIVTFNASSYSSVDTWEDFFDDFSRSPFAISCLAHPQTVGGSTKGLWNFCLDKNNSPRFRQMVHLLEMGNGSPIKSNLIHEYVYSLALDNGFRISPTCNSDCHGPLWGYDCFPGKTVIMAPERSKEAFTDALNNNRVYATESGNVKLFWSVCGKPAPADLPPTSKYDIHVEISLFHEDPATVPVKCQVISDYGLCVKTLEHFNASSFDFTVESHTARYFYLRLVDAEGRKTWSTPVWTGRPIDKKAVGTLIPLDKSGFTAKDETGGADASALLNDDPTDPWRSEGTTCSILIDMAQIQQIAGLGHYPQILDSAQLQQAGISHPEAVSHFPYEYRLATSRDGKDFTTAAAGVFRVFGGEEIISFEAHAARFLRLEILSTTGAHSEWKAYRDANIAMAELTVYQKG